MGIDNNNLRNIKIDFQSALVLFDDTFTYVGRNECLNRSDTRRVERDWFDHYKNSMKKRSKLKFGSLEGKGVNRDAKK